MTRQAGFTLLEVLIAVAITAVAAVMAYGGLDAAISAKAGVERQTDELRRLNRAFDVLARDFRQVIGRAVRAPSGYRSEHAFVLDEMAMPQLVFSRAGWTNPAAERFVRSQLQRVAYHYDGEKLIRYSWQMMDRYEDSDTAEIVLLDKVTAFRVRVMQRPDISQLDQLGSNVFINLPRSDNDQWLERWPPASNTGEQPEGVTVLPLAVEITLTLEPWGEIRRLFELAGADGP